MQHMMLCLVAAVVLTACLTMPGQAVPSHQFNELGSQEVEADTAVVMDEATDPNQPDRLLAIYNYIKQLVHGVTGGDEPGKVDMYNKIKDHMEETYAVQGPSDPSDLEEEAESERLCETRSQWTLLNRTVNTDGDPVEIVHDIYKQWYHYTQCVHADRPCAAVNESAFESQCVQTEGFQLMYARSLTTVDTRPSFMFVAVPRDCVCKAALRKKATSKRV